MQEVRGIETFRREGQGEGAARLAADEAAESDPCCQRVRNGDVLPGQIDSSDLTAVFMGEIPGRPAQPAADIQKPHSAVDAELAGEFHRRRPPPDVKLIHRGEVGQCKAVHILARGRERIQNRLLQRTVRIV